MIIKSLHLENIRSYAGMDEPINFPKGVVLFAGDIGSGKSTILYAIEFALFGLGSLSGDFLLRNGEKRGSVTLKFEVNGTEYVVHRALERRGRSVQQRECYLEGPEGREYLSPSEMKERILQILGFNEPANPRAKSVIFRYAIFTPQEEMKQIILESAESRLQTLRKALRIEDYKTAVQNSALLTAKIQGRVEYLKGATSDLEEKRKELDEIRKRIVELGEKLKPLDAKKRELEGKIGDIEKRLRELREEKERLRGIEARLPVLRERLGDFESNLSTLIEELQRLKKELNDEIKPRIKELESLARPTDKTLEELDRELEDTREKLKRAQTMHGKLEERIENVESLLKSGVCPVCERPVDPAEFGKKGAHLKDEIRKLSEEIGKLQEKEDELEKLIEKTKEYEQSRKELEELRKCMEEKEKLRGEKEQARKELEGKINELKGEIQEAEKELKPLEGIRQELERLEAENEKLQKELDDLRTTIKEISAEIKVQRQSEENLLKEIERKEKQLEEIKELSEYRTWLEEFFTPTVESIERHVMARINLRFNELFRKWFSILIEDPELQVRVDEDFTPIIERSGYEQRYDTLSGGERTSVALAYRLALNTVVQEIATAAGAGLLILDEPTDGFSREQLFKVRDVLNELNCEQVILVSHERELEGFADHIIRVTKEGGASRVVAVR